MEQEKKKKKEKPHGKVIKMMCEFKNWAPKQKNVFLNLECKLSFVQKHTGLNFSV